MPGGGQLYLSLGFQKLTKMGPACTKGDTICIVADKFDENRTIHWQGDIIRG
jgi:hypothetical protein